MDDNKDPQNLWSTLLKESSKRFKAPEATCVFLGDIDIGKNTLLSKIGGSSTFESDGNSRVIKDIISYTFIDVDEGLLDSDSLSRINLWSISNKTFEGCIDHVVKSGKSERLLFMVGVDISQPDSCLDGLKRWLRKVRKLATQRNAFTAGTGSTVGWGSLGLHIVIVACKSDLVKVDDAASLKKAKAIQGQLRAIGLLVGAAVVYTSALADTNTARLRKYIIHTLYPEAVAVEGGIEDGTASAFIPEGADSAELILIATGLCTAGPEGLVAEALLDSPCNEEEGTEQSALAPLAGLDLEPEEDWLCGLQSFISDVTSSGGLQSAPQGAGSGIGAGLTVVTDASTTEPTVKSVTRRNFRAPVAAQGKQDVDDFFQKLLEGGGPGPKK